MWISSVTDQAIRQGFKKLEDGKKYYDLYQAAVARAQADWIVGLNASRALTCKYNASLSCGRVQTPPTLNMIHIREKTIAKFKAVNLYGIDLMAGKMKYLLVKNNQHHWVKDEKVMTDIKSNLNGKSMLIQSVVKKQKKRKAKELYDLTSLQRDANSLYDYSAKETLRLMQNLYETHKILTYPRTDSRYLTKDIVPTLKDRLRSIQIGPFKSPVTKILQSQITSNKGFVNDQKVTDHHAIIPTEEVVDLSALTSKEYKVYELVVNRFIETLGKAEQYFELTISGKVDQYQFMHKSEISDDKLILPKNGEKREIDTLTLNKRQTTPPARFTEGTLLGAMENPSAYLEEADDSLKKTLRESGGLGTVATRADIIEKLYDHQYMEKRGKFLYTTKKRDDNSLN